MMFKKAFAGMMVTLTLGAMAAQAQSFARGALHQQSPRLRANYPVLAGHLCDPIPLLIFQGEEGFFAIDMRKDGPHGLNDPYLILIDAQGQILDRDDDSGGGLDARITRYLQPGLYFILASTYDTDRRSLGQYLVSVTRLQRLADGRLTPERNQSMISPQQPFESNADFNRRVATIFSQIDPVQLPPEGAPTGPAPQQRRVNPLQGILIPTSSRPNTGPSNPPRRNDQSSGSSTHIRNER